MAEHGEALSQREREVLELVATGMTNRQIAQELVVSPNTVKVHLRNVFTKLGVESRTEATLTAIREGWVSVPVEKSAPAEVEPSVQALPDKPPALPPLPWVKRLALVGMLLLVTVVSVATWPRSPMAADGSTETDNPRNSGNGGLGESGKWRALAPMLTARSRHALVAVHDQLFAIGGATHGDITGAVERYDPTVDQWTGLNAGKPTRVSNIGAAAIGERIVVPGGWTPQEKPTELVEVYDLESETWSQVASLPRPLCAYALAVYKDRVYLFGGIDDRGQTNTTYIYDPQTDNWSKGQNMPTRRAYAAAATINTRIFVVGGFDSKHEQNTCEAYSPEEDSWETCEPLFMGRGGLGLASVGNRLYIIGGGWSDDNDLTFNEEYDPKYNIRGFFGTSVNQEWHNLAVASRLNKFYVAGGWNGDYLNNVWEYVPLDNLIFIPSP